MAVWVDIMIIYKDVVVLHVSAFVGHLYRGTQQRKLIMAGYVKMCNSEGEIKMLKWLKRI